MTRSVSAARTLKPTRSTLILIGACCVLPLGFSILALWFLATYTPAPFSENWAYAVALSLGGLGLAVWMFSEVFTLSVTVTPDQVEYRQYWGLRWRIPRASIKLADGLIRGFVPILSFGNEMTGQWRGRILPQQFAAADVDWLRKELAR